MPCELAVTGTAHLARKVQYSSVQTEPAMKGGVEKGRGSRCKGLGGYVEVSKEKVIRCECGVIHDRL
jgi:hypothetical protein